jgi:hypothetical protein
MNWMFWMQAAAAAYLVLVPLLINTENIKSALLFKVFPMSIGLPLAFGVAGRLLGWPI